MINSLSKKRKRKEKNFLMDKDLRDLIESFFYGFNFENYDLDFKII